MRFATSSALCVATFFVVASTASAGVLLPSVISAGTFTGKIGESAEFSGETGGTGRALSGGNYLITGGTFTGGEGGYGLTFFNEFDPENSIDGDGGTGGTGLSVTDSATVTITGGTFVGGLGGAGTGRTGDRGVSARFTGGSTATISGGNFSGNIVVDGGANVTLVGSFNLPTGTVFTSSLIAGSTLTGTLAGNAASSTLTYVVFPGSSITLAAVPEPTTLAALAGVGLVALRRSRRA